MKNIFSGGRNTLVGSGTLASKVTLLVSGIDILILNGSIDIEVRPGNVTKAEIVADDNLIDLILVEQKGNKITIDIKDNSSYSTNNTMKVVLSLPNSLQSLILHGSGDIESFDSGCKKLDLIELHGSGDIKIDTIETTKLTVLLHGDGDVLLHKGEVTNASYTIEGSGDIIAKDVVCKIVTATVVGNGDIKLRFTESLRAVVKGNGDILYHGDSLNVSKTEIGNGDIKKIK